jgi:hypothetical protein
MHSLVVKKYVHLQVYNTYRSKKLYENEHTNNINWIYYLYLGNFHSRLVLLGMTANNLIIAKRHITNYKHDPEVYYLTDVDLDLDGLEVSSVLPVCLIGLDSSCYRYELIIRVLERTRYVLICFTFDCLSQFKVTQTSRSI